jgi:hypothetical protein
MARNSISKRNVNSRTGVILLGISSLILLGNVGWFAIQLDRFATSFGFDAVDRPIAIVLGGLQLLRMFAFNHEMTFCVMTDILLLCVALGGILTGFSMLSRQTVETV